MSCGACGGECGLSCGVLGSECGVWVKEVWFIVHCQGEGNVVRQAF